MSKHGPYAQGSPSWVDLQTSNPAAAKAFYSSLFGWSYDDQPMGEGAVYSIATVDSDSVAGLAPQSPDMIAAGVPPMWNTYLAVDDCDGAVARASAAGGQVVMPTMDVPGAGRMAFVTDPSGATVGFWQAGAHIGATRVNEPGTLIWNELITDNAATALPFYAAVAGISTSEMKMGEGDPYTLLEVDGAQVGGTTAPPMAGVPNHWHVYFAVADTDDTASKVTAGGGSIVVEPFDSPVGRIAVATDPQGALFSFMTMAEAG
jgi:uncharacterized protein